MYLGQLPKLWSTFTVKPRAWAIGDAAVQSVAPARVRLDAQQPDRRAVAQRSGQRIVLPGLRAHHELARIRRTGEAGLARQRRRPGLRLRIQAAHDEERQLGEEFAVLVGHVVADHARADFGQPRARSGALLQRQLAFVECGGVHARFLQAARPTRLRAIGTKRGSASMRASHARTFGYGSSETLPSGACAV